MVGPRFDAWTRRRFGLATGTALAVMLGLRDGEADARRKKKKRRRCKKLYDTCTQGGKRKCCGELRCERRVANIGFHTQCCKPEGATCSDESSLECCDELACGPANTCVLTPSDRNLKANFGSVDPADMLARVRDLPIAAWTFTHDDGSIRHIGPTAQDFAAAFRVGADDRHIHPIDGQGVALAAIQGLAADIARLCGEREALANRVRRLELTQG